MVRFTLVLFVAVVLQLSAPSVASSPSLFTERNVSLLRHKVQSGQTLGQIAQLYGTTVSSLRQINPFLNVLIPGGDIFVVSQYREAVVSWYGKAFNGKKTASGEKFHENKSIVAHKKLPLGSWIELFNPETNAVVLAQVLDRGPYIKGREFDVSKGIANKLGMTKDGVVKLTVRILHVPVE